MILKAKSFLYRSTYRHNKTYKYHTQGKLRYANSGWVVIDCPFDIVYYYNRVCNWLLWTNGRITTPLHGAHITVVAGKYTKVEKNWGYRDGDVVDVWYGPLQNTTEYYWLPVYCPDAMDVRINLGLTAYPKFQYHLTVGHNNS